MQYGGGGRGETNPTTGEPIAGDGRLPEGELEANRADSPADLLAHPFVDGFYRERTARLHDITVPLLSAGNGGTTCTPAATSKATPPSVSEQKWLEVHGLEHFAEFYTDYGVALQKRFFGHFLKGEDTGWDRQPPVQIERGPFAADTEITGPAAVGCSSRRAPRTPTCS